MRYDINNPGEFIPVDDCALYQMAENVKSGSRMMLAVAAAAGIAAVFFPDIFSRY